MADVRPEDVRVKFWGGSIQIDVVAADEAATGFCGVDIAKTAAAKGGRQQQRVALAIAEAWRVQVDVASDAISNKGTTHAIFNSAARRSPQKSSSHAQRKNTAAVHRLFSSCRAGASIAFSAKRDGKPSPPTKEEMDGGSATFVNESGAKYGHSCHGRSRSGVIPIQTTGYGASLVHFVRSVVQGLAELSMNDCSVKSAKAMAPCRSSTFVDRWHRGSRPPKTTAYGCGGPGPQRHCRMRAGRTEAVLDSKMLRSRSGRPSCGTQNLRSRWRRRAVPFTWTKSRY